MDNVGNTSVVFTITLEFDNTGSTISWGSGSSSSSVQQVNEVALMDYEQVDEKEVVENSEENTNEVQVIEENKLVKVLNNEMIEVIHVPVINALDYVLSNLHTSIVIGGSYLFIKERKRINVA